MSKLTHMSEMEKQAFIAGILTGAQKMLQASKPGLTSLRRNAVAMANPIRKGITGQLSPIQTAQRLARNPVARGLASTAAGYGVAKMTDSPAAGVATGLLASRGLRSFGRF